MKNPNIMITNCSGYYCDICGNEIQGKFEGLKVNFSGINNFLYIGENCKFKGSIELHIKNGSSIIIEDNANITGNATIISEYESILYIGENCNFFSAYIYSGLHSVIKVSKNFTSGGNLGLVCSQKGLCFIGKDCMLSGNVVVHSTDGHNIYDLEKCENINENKNYEIIIGDHVWVGLGVTILYGAQVGSGCIIGINSFVNKKFPNNTIIAGNPAKIVRENIAWSRTAYPFINEEEKFKEFDFRKK